MRQIKFRVFDKDGKRMIDWDFIRQNWLCNGLIGDEGMVTMQFTGLTDKNGKEIYEGDIVVYKFDSRKSDFATFTVGWISNLTHNGWNVKEPASKRGFYEVIGNIYENPELLNNL